jgi:cell division protein FtsB
MDRRRATDPEPERPIDDGIPELPDDVEAPAPPSADAIVRGLPVAGVSRRRIAFLVGALVVAWVVIVFARQVGEATAATGRADAAAAENGRLTAEVAALQRELDLVQTRPYIVQEARAYELGSKGEVPFRLAADASPLPSDAPGSASLRIGTPPAPRSPLESWLTLLFGSDR